MSRVISILTVALFHGDLHGHGFHSDLHLFSRWYSQWRFFHPSQISLKFSPPGNSSQVTWWSPIPDVVLGNTTIRWLVQINLKFFEVPMDLLTLYRHCSFFFAGFSECIAAARNRKELISITWPSQLSLGPFKMFNLLTSLSNICGIDSIHDTISIEAGVGWNYRMESEIPLSGGGRLLLVFSIFDFWACPHDLHVHVHIRYALHFRVLIIWLQFFWISGVILGVAVKFCRWRSHSHYFLKY